MSAAYPALVLNADLSPINIYPLSVWDFARTMRNMLKKSVIALEYYDTTLHSPTISYRPPSVVALKQDIKTPQYVAFTRMNVFLRDEFRCQYCGEKHATEDLTFDHVIPQSQGGPTNWTNIVSACVPCNSRKADRRDMKPLREPVQPDPHSMRKLRQIDAARLHRSWHDYLYWSGLLLQ